MRRRAKVITALFLVVAAAALIFWNTGTASPTPALGVSDAKWKAPTLEGREVNVRGNVVQGSIVEVDGKIVEFIVADDFEQLRVLYNQTPPDNFGPKEVMAKGELVIVEGVPVLQASSLQVGCASKY